MSGPVAIKNLTFATQSQTKLFDNLTLEVEKSTRVAMLEELALEKYFSSVMFGFVLPDDGMVLVDGTNITQVRPEDLRKNFGVVPQTFSLFWNCWRKYHNWCG